MTAARLTAAEARRLGIDPGPARTGRTTRKEADGLYLTRCATCGATFETVAGEDRHVTLTHCRFELVLGKPLYRCDRCGRLSYDLATHKCRVRS